MRKGRNSSLENGLASLVKRMDSKSGGAYTQARVGLLWQEIAGPQVTAHTTGAHLRDGTLVVYVDGAAWATELTAMAEVYRLALNKGLGKNPVRKITFTVSRKVAQEHQLRRIETLDKGFYSQDIVESVPLTETERAQIEASAQCIPDDELRTAAVKATIKDLEWKKGLAARNAREKAGDGV